VPFMSDGGGVALDIDILLRLTGLDVAQGGSLRFGPSHKFSNDIFRSIIHTNGDRFAAPLDDLVQAADDAFSRQRKIHLDAQHLAVEVVQDIQQPELPSVFQSIRHEIHGSSNRSSQFPSLLRRCAANALSSSR